MAVRKKDPAEQLAKEIAREAAFLPDRWRAWLLNELRKHYEAADLEARRIDQLNKRMSEAVKALDRVAEHLQLDGQARLDLTMREFDAVADSVRQGWTARRVASSVRGSWVSAKGTAFAGEILPTASERQWEMKEGLARKRREGRFILNGVKAWLETKPKERTRNSYDAWARARNKQLEPGERRIPLGKALWERWRLPLAEIFQAAETDRVPGEDASAPASGVQMSEVSPDQAEQSPPLTLNLDPVYRGEQIKAARESRQWSIRELAIRSGLDPSQIGKIEKAQARNPNFETLARLAHVLDLSLDELAAGPPSDLASNP